VKENDGAREGQTGHDHHVYCDDRADESVIEVSGSGDVKERYGK
jgi:hypothetical protein